jgi:hypothetical protein
VSTLVLISDGLPGDFNRDGAVDMADYIVWRKLSGETGDLAADANEDNIVDADDYALWRANFGRSVTAAGQVKGGMVPEPFSLTLAIAAVPIAILARQRTSF